MILLGPYEPKSPDAMDLQKMDQSFVSAVDLADVALRLAALKGLNEPDVAGAIRLLKQAWNQRHQLTPLRCAGMMLTTDLKSLAVAAVSDPDAFDKDFPGSDQIVEPDEFPAALDVALKLITKEYSRKRRCGYLLRMENELRQRMGFAIVSEPRSAEDVEDAASFWGLARNLAPYCPRFVHLYGGSKLPGGSSMSKKSRMVKKSS